MSFLLLETLLQGLSSSSPKCCLHDRIPLRVSLDLTFLNLPTNGVATVVSHRLPTCLILVPTIGTLVILGSRIDRHIAIANDMSCFVGVVTAGLRPATTWSLRRLLVRTLLGSR